MEKIWINSYPKDVPETLHIDTYQSIPEAMETYFAQYANKEAFINFGTHITYQTLDRQTRQFAAFLQQQLQMKKGDRFAIILPNILQFPIALFGALRAGLIVTNVNPLYTAHELAFQLKDSGATTIIILENFVHELALALPDTSVKQVIITKLGDCLGWFKGPIANGINKWIKRQVPAWHITAAIQVISFQQAIKQGNHLPLEKVALTGDDIAFLQYTGGTTGIPKGTMLTHRNIIANVTQCVAWVKSSLNMGRETVLTALPLYHIFSLTVCCFCFMAIGSRCLLITNPRDLNGLIKSLRKIPVTIFIGLNTLFNGLLNHPRFSEIKSNTLKLVISGGMALQQSVADAWQKNTGTVIIEGYGLTEASPVVSINPLNTSSFNGSIGLPVPETTVSIRDDTGQEVSLGKPGELWVRGPQVMRGYWHNPVETALVLDQEQWLHTGDLAQMDARGFIYILDRKKDLIIVSGFNVYPNEVETVIASHPQVREVAVVGEPSEKSGEIVKAYIVAAPDITTPLTADDIVSYCRERLTGYKIPKQIEFCAQLPKTAVGKVLRRALRHS